jgi:hypothetical protein
MKAPLPPLLPLLLLLASLTSTEPFAASRGPLFSQSLKLNLLTPRKSETLGNLDLESVEYEYSLQDRGLSSLQPLNFNIIATDSPEKVGNEDSLLDRGLSSLPPYLNLITPVYPEKVEYADNFVEKSAIGALSLALALLSKKPIPALKKVGVTYDDFVATSFEFMKEREPEEMKERLVGLLALIVPSPVKKLFAEKYEEMPLVVKENSVKWFSFNILRFLVGPAEIRSQTSLLLTECRYLKEAGEKIMVERLNSLSNVVLLPLFLKPLPSVSLPSHCLLLSGH